MLKSNVERKNVEFIWNETLQRVFARNIGIYLIETVALNGVLSINERHLEQLMVQFSDRMKF